jgi:ELWxxDGT repeat protein
MKLFFLSLLACTSLCAWAQAPVFQFTCLDVNTGSGDSNPEAFCVLNNKLLFIANDGIHGKEMWITDGTQAGTHIVKDITPGSLSSYLSGACAMGNLAYLSVQTAAQGKECG